MRSRASVIAVVLSLAGCGLGSGSVSGGDAGADGGPLDAGRGDAGSAEDSGVVDAGSPDAGGAVDAGVVDPCPDLPIPATCYGKSVVFREWSPTATGDNTYFASQAPWRLGFTRLHNQIWIMKFRLDANTYLARITATGDTYGAAGWISDEPCAAGFGVAAGTVAYGMTGTVNLEFAAVRDVADLQEIRTNPAYAALNQYSPLLFGGHCYYLVYENADLPPTYPLTESYLSSVPDRCGEANGTPDCYYLAIDFFHFLDNPVTGQRSAGAVINGLTH